MTGRCLNLRQCRWCGEVVNRDSKTGLCRKHWVEYAGMVADIMNTKDINYDKYTECKCGRRKLKKSEICFRCKNEANPTTYKERQPKEYEKCSCGRTYKTRRAAKCWLCHCEIVGKKS